MRGIRGCDVLLNIASADSPLTTAANLHCNGVRIRFTVEQSSTHHIDRTRVSTPESGKGASYPIAEWRILNERPAPIENDSIKCTHDRNLPGDKVLKPLGVR